MNSAQQTVSLGRKPASGRLALTVMLLLQLFLGQQLYADEQGSKNGPPVAGDLPLESIADFRDSPTKIKVNKQDVVVVPIPTSNPTFGTGLILGGAYFYAQSEAEKQLQPASYTGVVGLYTNNESYAAGLLQQNYWQADTWRLSASAGYANFRLELRDPTSDQDGSIDWLVKGFFSQASLSRRLIGDWYLGGQLRYLTIEQNLNIQGENSDDIFGSNIDAVGLGATVEYDSRDMPTNAYKGSNFFAMASVNSTSGDSEVNYRAYSARYRYYYQVAAPVVLATDINGCLKSGPVPLWDACRLSLRGFPLTEYIGKASLYLQGEARWRVYKRFGLVAFAGYGYIGNSVSDALEDEKVPSYGMGFRYTVLKSKRINLRLDFARSGSSEAVYVSAGEAF